MKFSSNILAPKIGPYTLVSLFFSSCIVFLQSGYSYYVSIQVLALFLIFIFIFKSDPVVTNSRKLFFTFFLLSLFIGMTALSSPTVVSRNSANIAFTVIGVLAFSFLIVLLSHMRLRRVRVALLVFRSTSSFVVILLACLFVMTDSPFFYFLNRDILLLQNSSLVTNYSNLDALLNELAYRSMNDIPPRIDLFYGEPSYLAIVLFSCLVCYMITSKLLLKLANVNVRDISSPNSVVSNKLYFSVIIFGIVSLLYVQSLSSIIYALLIFYYSIEFKLRKMLAPTNILIFILVLILLFPFVLGSYEYVSYRVSTIHESLSASQRFGSFLDFHAIDYFIGLRDVSRMPREGFHNGLLYTIAVSGVAGIYYVYVLLSKAYCLAKPLGMSSLVFFLILALIMQNGAIFSPNKVVLLSMILVPLSCVSVVYRKLPSIKSREFVSV